METLIQRLVANPHDEEALAYAHRAGTQDPRSYAILLEKVGSATSDPAYAAHWLSEAANVWSTTIGDAHHAARTLMIAIDKDPTQRTAAERLAQLYRDKGDQKALVALLERLVKSLTPLAPHNAEVRSQLAALHEELGRLWSEPPLTRPERALENWKRLAEYDPQNAYAIYAAREMLKSQQQYAEAVPYFAMEQAIVDDPERKLALYRDEADIRRRAGDLAGASMALRSARALRPDDVALKQELGLAVLDRVEGGEPVPSTERDEAAGLFVSLAETYDGAYGFDFAVSALRASAGHDRGMQLADYYATQLNRTAELQPRYQAYLQANPSGFMANEIRAKAGMPRPPLPPPPGGRVPTPLPPPPGGRPPGALDRPSSPQFRAAAAPPGMPSFPSQSPSQPSFDPNVPPAAAAAFNAPAAVPAPAATPAPSPVAAPAPSGTADIATLLEEAQTESAKGKKPQALAKFKEVLKIDPANAEALSWVEEHLRQKRMYAELRDVLLAASRAPNVSPDTKKRQLLDVAGLCESQLRDLEMAIQAWKQIVQLDRADEQAREQLRRLLERGSRWDDLATLLEQEAMGAPDVEQKIALEKKLAQLHETKRKDPAAAAEAWARIANLAPEDETSINTAVKLYEKGEKLDLAAQVIADNVGGVSDKNARGLLLQKLGELRLKTDDASGAGDAFAEAADLLEQAKIWEQAEKAYMTAGRHVDAANALDHRAQAVEGKQQAALYAQAGDLLLKAGEVQQAIAKLEQAAEIDPTNDAFAETLQGLYKQDGREPDLVKFLVARAEKLTDKGKRVASRRTAATIQRDMGDKEGARETLLQLLSDGDDAESLALLVEDAVERSDFQEAVELLRRHGALVKEPAEKLALALREAEILAENLDDVEGAIERYEAIVKTIDEKNRYALHAIGDLEERRQNFQGAAEALEREIPLAEGAEKVELAQRLAQIYENQVPNPRAAIRALEIVHEAEPEDFDAIARLQKLCEDVEDWPRVATLMAQLVEIEGDEEEASRLTRHLADILSDKLQKGDEALAALEKLADTGDEPCRAAYVELGDKLGWKGIVAMKLVAWNESGSGPDRNAALRSAFDRFVEIGREQDAARVAMELARSRGADAELASKLEEIATRLKDLDALSTAHEILARELSGPQRAAELVRQAEVQVEAGIDPLEAMQHGESALTSVAPGEVEPLLARLAALTQAPGHIIDLYERQVGRCRVPTDRLAALARAAQIAAERGAHDRARSFFELALGGGVQEDTIASLEAAARAGDERENGTGLRTILAEALAAGGQGSRDGGRTRAALLRRAATLAHRDLNDVDRAFGWLGDALITHVDDPSLEALEALGREVNDMQRVEATLSRALDEVFDGPLVRKLLHRRAKLRRDVLGDRKGAAVDLKKLHDLSPSDQDVMNDLSGLLLELGDHRGMIQLYEDQILRGRDPSLRAELARKVARIWEEDLGDAREAADAWRRVLRMKAGDQEATAGLDRAKSGKLKRTPPGPTVPLTTATPDASAAYAYADAPAAEIPVPPTTDPGGWGEPQAYAPPSENALPAAAAEPYAAYPDHPVQQELAPHEYPHEAMPSTDPHAHDAGHEHTPHDSVEPEPTGPISAPGFTNGPSANYAQPGYDAHAAQHEHAQHALDAQAGYVDPNAHAGFAHPGYEHAGYAQPGADPYAQQPAYDPAYAPQQAEHDPSAHAGYAYPADPAHAFDAQQAAGAHAQHHLDPHAGEENVAEVDDAELLEEEDHNPHP